MDRTAVVDDIAAETVPMPPIGASPAGVHRRCATMRPSVIVPVVSVAITPTEPASPPLASDPQSHA